MFDKVEEKRQMEDLGLMPLSRAVKYSLLSLRLYLILMGGLVFYRALHEFGIAERSIIVYHMSIKFQTRRVIVHKTIHNTLELT
jgi:hypothetical protein